MRCAQSHRIFRRLSTTPFPWDWRRLYRLLVVCPLIFHHGRAAAGDARLLPRPPRPPPRAERRAAAQVPRACCTARTRPHVDTRKQPPPVHAWGHGGRAQRRVSGAPARPHLTGPIHGSTRGAHDALRVALNGSGARGTSSTPGAPIRVWRLAPAAGGVGAAPPSQCTAPVSTGRAARRSATHVVGPCPPCKLYRKGGTPGGRCGRWWRVSLDRKATMPLALPPATACPCLR